MKKIKVLFATLMALLIICSSAMANPLLNDIYLVDFPDDINVGRDFTLKITTNGLYDADKIIADISLVPIGYQNGVTDFYITLSRTSTKQYQGSATVPNAAVQSAKIVISTLEFKKGNTRLAFASGQSLNELNDKISAIADNPYSDDNSNSGSLSEPTITSPTATELNKSDISFCWEDVSNADKFSVALYDNTNSSYITLTTPDTTSTSFIVPSAKLTEGHEYNFTVTAKNDSYSRSDSKTFKIKSSSIAVSTVELNSTGFSDLSEGHWAYPSIKNLINKGCIEGYADKTFKPKNNITRAEFIMVLVRALNLTNTNSQTGFSDVPNNHWAANEIAAAKSAGITEGYSDGTFKPKGNITRAEIVSMINSAKKLSTGSSSINFKDISNHWAKDAIINAATNGIVSGYSDGTFKPNNKATRAEACIMIDMMLKKQ